MALYSPIAFDGSITLGKLGLSLIFFFSFPAHTNSFFCVRKKEFCFFHTSRWHIYFNALRNDGARWSAWDTGNNTVVLYLVAKLGIVGGSPLSMCFWRSIGPNLIVILQCRLDDNHFPAHANSFFCVRKKVFRFFPRRDGIFTLILSGMMLLEEARGIWGTTL